MEKEFPSQTVSRTLQRRKQPGRRSCSSDSVSVPPAGSFLTIIPLRSELGALDFPGLLQNHVSTEPTAELLPLAKSLGWQQRRGSGAALLIEMFLFIPTSFLLKAVFTAKFQSC